MGNQLSEGWEEAGKKKEEESKPLLCHREELSNTRPISQPSQRGGRAVPSRPRSRGTEGPVLTEKSLAGPPHAKPCKPPGSGGQPDTICCLGRCPGWAEHRMERDGAGRAENRISAAHVAMVTVLFQV